MAFPQATKENAVLGAKASNFAFASLHTGAAGTTGANEATGGSPAYARKPATWTDGAADGSTTAAAITFDVPAGSYVEIGFFSAVTGGNFGGSLALAATQSPTGQAQITVTPTITVN